MNQTIFIVLRVNCLFRHKPNLLYTKKVDMVGIFTQIKILLRLLILQLLFATKTWGVHRICVEGVIRVIYCIQNMFLLPPKILILFEIQNVKTIEQKIKLLLYRARNWNSCGCGLCPPAPPPVYAHEQ